METKKHSMSALYGVQIIAYEEGLQRLVLIELVYTSIG